MRAHKVIHTLRCHEGMLGKRPPDLAQAHRSNVSDFSQDLIVSRKQEGWPFPHHCLRHRGVVTQTDLPPLRASKQDGEGCEWGGEMRILRQ